MAYSVRELLRLHVEAVWGIPVPQLDTADVTLAEGVTPRWKVYHARLTEGEARIWRADVLPEERAELAATTDRALAHPDEAIAGVVREVALRLATEPTIPVEQAALSARRLTIDDDPGMRAFYEQAGYHLGGPQEPIIGVTEAGRVVTVAHSSRRTGQACELGINTLTEARRRGYALAATVLWTRAILDEGLIPFYSALAENTASLALADAAGYRELARAAHVTR